MDAWLAVLPGTLTVVALTSFALALALLIGAAIALRRRRLLGASVRLILAMLFGGVVALLSLLALGIQGYRALTNEETAAVVAVEPSGEQRFVARFLFPDGRTMSVTLAGNELYVDARILKWKYWANVAGLKTAYELDRVSGRYRLLEDELSKPRTVQSLAPQRPVNLFDLRSRFQSLSPLYDAQYGSATFVPADKPAMYEILVSTTGLLARPIHAASEPISN